MTSSCSTEALKRRCVSVTLLSLPHNAHPCPSDIYVSPAGFDNQSCGALTLPCLTIRVRYPRFALLRLNSSQYAADEALTQLTAGGCNASATLWLLPGLYTGLGNKNLLLDGRSSNFSLFSIQGTFRRSLAAP